MKILMMTFSPNGHTMRVAKRIENQLAENNEVQHIDLTADAQIFDEAKVDAYLKNTVKAHDLLIFSMPVYEKHVEFYIKRFLQHIPAVNDIYGKNVALMVTYGGISSGKCLYELGQIFEKALSRKVVAAMKLESEHLVVDKLEASVNPGMPGTEAEPFIADFVSKILNIESMDLNKSVVSKLNYQGLRETIICKILKEEKMHRTMYPRLDIDAGKCVGCLKCVKNCSVQRIKVVDGKPVMPDADHLCIHCFVCYNGCNNRAIGPENGQEGWDYLNHVFNLVSKDGSVIQSNEKPRSEVFGLPIK